MQKHLFWLLTLIVFFPSLYPLSQHAGAIMLVTAYAMTSMFLYAVIYAPVLKPWLDTPWPFPILVVTQCILLAMLNTSMSTVITPLCFIFAVHTLRRTRHPWLQINRFSLCLYACLLMWPATSSPLPAIGLLIFSLTILLAQQRVALIEIGARILLLASTTIFHPTLAILPVLTGFSLLATWPKRAIATAALGTAISVAILYLAPPTAFKTMQIELLLPDTSFAAAAILLAIVIIQSLYHWRWWPPTQHAAWMLGSLLYILSLAELAQTGSLSSWSTAPLLTLALPLVVHTLLRPTFKHK